VAVYITGDTHGDIDIHKLAKQNWPEGETLTKDDFLIIAGDFGLVWNGGSNDKWWQRWLDAKPWTTLFIDGNHENHDMLDAMPTTTMFGAPVHMVQPSIIHLMRGYVYDIPTNYESDTISVLAMGGAQSIDRAWRKPGISWWEQEVPSNEERKRCLDNLTSRNNQVDFIVTHDCPSTVRQAIQYAIHESDVEMNEFERWLSNLEACEYRRWYMGHWHIDATLDSMHVALYHDIERIA
jgi:hypothetical protein